MPLKLILRLLLVVLAIRIVVYTFRSRLVSTLTALTSVVWNWRIREVEEQLLLIGNREYLE